MAWTQQANDTFTDTYLTVLTSHTPDSGSAWSQCDSSAVIGINNRFFVNAGVNTDSWAMNGTTLADKQACEAGYTGGSEYGYLWLRLSGTLGSTWSGYALIVRGSPFHDYIIRRLDNNSPTGLKSGSQTVNSNDVIRFECDGSTLTYLINGSTVDSTTDATYSSGKSGIGAYASFVEVWDNWKAYDESGTTPPHVRLGVFDPLLNRYAWFDHTLP